MSREVYHRHGMALFHLTFISVENTHSKKYINIMLRYINNMFHCS